MFDVSKTVFIFALCVILSACGGAPQVGPTERDVTRGARSGTILYDLAPIDAEVARLTRFEAIFRMPQTLLAEIEEDYAKLRIGDTLSLRIWESVDDGVFNPLGSRAAPIEGVTVDEVGRIFVPYVGDVEAAGRTIEEVREDIRAALEERTQDPQIEIRRTEEAPRSVSVQGDVRTPGVYPLTLRARSLLPVLALAGGATTDPDQAFVLVRRAIEAGVLEGRIPLSAIYRRAVYNLPLRTGDVIILDQDRRYYNMMGSIGAPGRKTFSARDVSLMDAIAEAGGLKANEADPTGVFVFRFERPDVLNRILHKRIQRPDTGPRNMVADIEESELATLDASEEGYRRVVYQMALDDPDALFHAQGFQLRDQDLIFVTTAPLVEWNRIINLVIPAVSTPVNALSQLTSLGQ